MRIGLFFLALAALTTLHADTGHAAWLTYQRLDPATRVIVADSLPDVVVTAGDSPVEMTARDELVRGVRGMLGRTERIEQKLPNGNSVILGTGPEIRRLLAGAQLPASLGEDAFCVKTVDSAGKRHLIIAGGNDRGVLYGTFALLRRIALHEPMFMLNDVQTPYARIRWINQWDNLDGTIERGYGGPSLFFEKDDVRSDLSRVRDYARLLASLGINGCSINNVNANPKVISTEFLPHVARIAEVFRPWGIRMVLSVDFGSPKRVGGMDTIDPADPRVAAWWKQKADEIYRVIPDLGGFVMKADSEGRVGPSAYGRSHADAANTIARALKPHGGLLFYRAFVYDHNLDWRNLKNDRARAAYDNFHGLDGKFDDNVVIQIKNGPIDFQVREPASPLFAGLEKTNEAIELQITQEYFGQGRHTVYLGPYWKDTLDTDTFAGRAGTPVKALVTGKVFERPTGGFVGVSNVGMDDNWFGNHLSQANLYAFGRLAWNPDLSSDDILSEWTQQTFVHDPTVNEVIDTIQAQSWRTYEDYTGPLGLQTLTAITGTHYGPAVEASERNGWGQWHRADEKGVGMDRTVATGTGFIGQYRPPVAQKFESVESCPDDLILFMHHVPYTHVLHSGKTVIQTIYDLHYTGAQEVARWVDLWKSLRGRVDQQRYEEILAQLEYQAGHAIEWRDAVNTWFLRTSGIPDRENRAGSFPGRIEAESLDLNGYTVVNVTPWEAASSGKAIECKAPACSASYQFRGTPGWYSLRIRYFDQNDGVSRYRVSIDGQLIDHWSAADHLPSKHIDSSSSTLRVINGVALRTGDEIRIEGTPDGSERAAIDYLDLSPDTKNWTAADDHRNMMEQLGIKALRPGPSGNESAPNHANYDEAAANPFPNYPEVLRLTNGQPVTTPDQWWKLRRPELVEDFEREVIGRVPAHVPNVMWSVTRIVNDKVGPYPVIAKELRGHVDNSAYPPISVDIEMVVVTPAWVTTPVPLMIMFGRAALPSAPVPPLFARFAAMAGPDPPATMQLIADGWGYALLNPVSVQADNGAGLTKGIIGLVNKGQPRRPDDWGALRAWAWGASRGLDYLETDRAVDARRVGIEGVSRYGKAALVTMAFDPRFAVVLVGSSGEGGAKPHRRNFGEAVENLTGSGEYHWMAGNFLKYGGPKNAGDLPVDSHELIALCAPRLTFISYGVPEKGDARWLDQQGSFMATVAAGPVFRLLGARDTGVIGDYRTAKMPPVNTGLLGGQLAWRQHDGGHTDGPNWKYFIPWADKLLPHTAPPAPAFPADVPVPRMDANSMVAHAQLLEKTKKGRIDIYFEGDSITRRWGATDYPDLLANWKQNFFGWNAADFGWGADRTQNILWRLNNGELDGVNPKIVVLLAGTNNLSTQDGAVTDITRGLEGIVATIKAKAPGATIIVTGIFPRNDRMELIPVINPINANLAKMADGGKVRYVDINARLADSTGRLFDGMMNPDKLHPAAQGYQVWADALKPIFREVLGPPASEDHSPPPTGDPTAGR